MCGPCSQEDSKLGGETCKKKKKKSGGYTPELSKWFSLRDLENIRSRENRSPNTKVSLDLDKEVWHY